MNTTSWTTPFLLDNYDAVLIELSPINNTILTEYVNGGGGVFLVGGNGGAISDQYDEFLLNFDMSLQENVYSIENPVHVTLTSFVPHPVTNGVSSLETLNPTPIDLHSSDLLVLATWGGWHWLVVYSEELTDIAPTVTVMSPNGGEVWNGTQLIQWTAQDPDAQALTYTVQYSLDGGITWLNLTKGIEILSYPWDTTQFPDSSKYWICVVASDGTLTGVDSSDASFTISNALLPDSEIQVREFDPFGSLVVLMLVIVAIGPLLTLSSIRRRHHK